MANFLAELKKQGEQGEGVRLRPTETVEKRISIGQLIETEPQDDEDKRVRDYFFNSGVDEWYENLTDITFPSAFVSLSKADSNAIIQNWVRFHEVSLEDLNQTEKEKEIQKPTEIIPEELNDLINRIDNAIKDNFGPETKYKNKVFVKLSTRSPKDSFTIFQNALTDFEETIQSRNQSQEDIKDSTSLTSTFPMNLGSINLVENINDRLCLFSHLMIKHSAVENGREAVTIMLDSHRVVEDLREAYADDKESKGDKVSIVIRGWDDRITPSCEFRGFVWNRELTCVGQYWHHLYFPHLQDKKVQNEISSELVKFYETKIKSSMPVPSAMLDLVYFGPGDIILVEINPLTDGLGSFPGSTGLFDYEEEVLRGNAPFELRVCTKEAELPVLMKTMNPTWRTVIGK